METPEFSQTSCHNAQFTPERRLSDAQNGDHFVVDDLILDFPNDESMVGANGGLGGAMAGTSAHSSIAAVFDAPCNSSFSPAEPHYQAADVGGPHSIPEGYFSRELCVPHDDLAELEWLSNFVEESFSCEDLQKLQLIEGMKARNDEALETHLYQFQPETARPGLTFRTEMSVPAKARSKRSRAAHVNWTSRLLASSRKPAADGPAMSSPSESDIAVGKKSVKPAPPRKKDVPDNAGGGEGRKCLHCATDKTPQWRTGPMGPKTLCNACGVRYKSGRLVPEYRPAASPTFVLTKHSNSHRKVLELRRQKELLRGQQQQQFLHHHHQSMMFDVANGDDYLIHHHIGPDIRRLI